MMRQDDQRPLVIAHRGASGYLPEHTLAAYALAIEQGADFIEPDLVMTKDRVLVARHENALAVLNADGSIKEATTDVTDHPEFASRKTTKIIDGVTVTGWFTEDFSFSELRSLRARERIPRLRPGNARLDGSLCIPSFAEILDLVDSANQRKQREAQRLGLIQPKPIGVYPETKHPSYFAAQGLSMEQALVEILQKYGYRDRQAPVFIQSFEVSNLKHLRTFCDLPLIQLIEAEDRPYDFVLTGNVQTYSDLIKPEGLREIARYADGIGVAKEWVIPRDHEQKLRPPSLLVAHAHTVGLKVHAWTFRAENFFLPQPMRVGATTAGDQCGDLASEIRCFLDAGIDGLFVDHPDIAVKVRDAYCPNPLSA